MTNFLKETRDVLKAWGKAPSEVEWVGSSDGKYAISWQEFKAIANVEYDSGFGGQEIVMDIVIVGSDWWLSRSEYDGSEGWTLHTKPVKEEGAQSFLFVKDPADACWVNIEEANRPGGKYADL